MSRGRRSPGVYALAAMAIWQLGSAGLIHGKAWLAPLLIARAWDESIASGGQAVFPWPWADTWPVARLLVPRLGIVRYVLAGDSGQALAFGPGHIGSSAPLDSHGRSAIGGHRDTHFAFLADLQAGDRLVLQLPGGGSREYDVAALTVVDSRGGAVARSQTADELLLITCYPFDALRSGGPLRYVVTALPLGGIG